MEKLNDDTMVEILKFLELKHIALMGTCSKSMNNLVQKDEIWKNMIFKRWGEEFGERALARPVKISKPLESYHLEVKRMVMYENMAKKTYGKWDKDDYYTLWKFMDNPK